MICQKCGNEIPRWASGVCYNCDRIEREQRRYGRGRPKATRPSWRLWKKRRKVGDTTPAVPSSSAEARSPIPWAAGGDPKLLRQGINRLLEDIYDHPRYLSAILRDGGLTEAQIALLRHRKLTEYLSTLVQQWCVWFRSALPERQCVILVRWYSLDGLPADEVETLAVAHGTSRRNVQRSQISALKRLRASSSRKELERIAVEGAYRFVDRA